MFDDIFSLYYELFVVNSCRSYCLNKFDTSDRMNYFQSIVKYFFGMYNMARAALHGIHILLISKDVGRVE